MKKLTDALENIDKELREMDDVLKLRGQTKRIIHVEHYRGMLRAARLIIQDVTGAERGGWIE